MSGLTAFNYQKHLDNLVARNWLVDVFRRYLDTDPWPPSDEAHWQLVCTGGEGAGQVGAADSTLEISEVFRW